MLSEVVVAESERRRRRVRGAQGGCGVLHLSEGAAVGGMMVVVGHAAAFPAVMYDVSSSCVRAGGG